MDHAHYMQKLIHAAEQAAHMGEVPIAALLVVEGQEFSSQANQRHHRFNPFGHAESLVIQEASSHFKNWRLLNSTLYVTVEPCVMCTGAIYQSRIEQVVYGCKNPKGGALEFIHQHEKTLNLNHTLNIVSGVLEKECAELLQSFFQKKRADKKVAK